MSAHSRSLARHCQQIDQPYLDSQSNGLVYMIDRMKDQNIFAHVNC